MNMNAHISEIYIDILTRLILKQACDIIWILIYEKYFIKPLTIPMFNKRLSCHSEPLVLTYTANMSSQFKLIFYISMVIYIVRVYQVSFDTAC